MLAVDNVLRRRFLLGVNRNALMRASNNFELLLYAAARESNDASATTRSLLKTMAPAGEAGVDIMRDCDDGERVSDLDRLGGGRTHYEDLHMMAGNCLGRSVRVDILNRPPLLLGSTQPLPQALPQGLSQGLPQGLPQALPQGLSQGLPQGLPQGLSQALPQGLEEGLYGRGAGQEAPLQPRVAEHEYQCPLTDPYDRLLFEQRMDGAPPTAPAVAANPSAADMAGMAEAAGDKFNISPSMLYLTSDMLSPSECRICNFSAARLRFQVVSPPQELDVKPLSGTIEPYSTAVVLVECASRRGLTRRLSRYGRAGSSQAVTLAICVGSVTRRVEVRIQNLTGNAPEVVVEDPTHSLNAPFVLPDAQQYAAFPYTSPPPLGMQQPLGVQQPLGMQQPLGTTTTMGNTPNGTVQTGDADSFRYVGGVTRAEVTVHNNFVSIPAGMRERREFVAFVNNHSQKRVVVSVNQLLSPFSCDIQDAVVSP